MEIMVVPDGSLPTSDPTGDLKPVDGIPLPSMGARTERLERFYSQVFQLYNLLTATIYLFGCIRAKSAVVLKFEGDCLPLARFLHVGQRHVNIVDLRRLYHLGW